MARYRRVKEEERLRRGHSKRKRDVDCEESGYEILQRGTV